MVLVMMMLANFNDFDDFVDFDEFVDFVILMILIPRKLQQIELKGNPIHSFDPNAFVQLPALRKLQWVPFSNLYFYDFGNLPCPCVICISRLLGSPRVLNQFPNLTGSSNLELLHMDRCSSFHWLVG